MYCFQRHFQRLSTSDVVRVETPLELALSGPEPEAYREHIPASIGETAETAGAAADRRGPPS